MQDKDFEALGFVREWTGAGEVWQRGDGSGLHVVVSGDGGSIPKKDGPFIVSLYNCDEYLGAAEIEAGRSAGSMLRAMLSGFNAEYGV